MERLAFIGDLHLDSKNIGQHKDYYAVCKDVCEKITTFIEESEITKVFFTGDFTTKNITDYAGLQVYLGYFSKWNKMLGGEVYSIRGNHDFGATPRFFQILETAGLIKTKILDSLFCGYYDVGNARIHFMNYGETDKQIETEDAESKIHILLSHADWEAEGTAWYGGVEAGTKILANMDNLKAVDYIMNGHIHRPTDGIVQERISGADHKVSLMNLGCATRPSKEQDLWESVYFGVVDINDEGVLSNITFEMVELPDENDVYNPVKEEVQTVNILSVEELHNILEELKNLKVMDGENLANQVYTLAGLDKEAANIVLEALEKCGMQIQTSYSAIK